MQLLEDRRVPATLFGLTESNQLIRFDSSNPGAAIQITVTGLGATEHLTSIDYRPANEKLYAISDLNSSLYTINTTTGAATLIGAAGFIPVATRFGIDFNPTVDGIRFVSNAGNNLRINPDTGAVVAFDSGLNGDTTSLDEVAYTNNFAGATSTSLFGINSTTDSLYQVTDPNNGTTVLTGALGVDTDSRVGFDISLDDGNAYATLTVGGVSKLYTIDLTSGAATLVGTIGSGTPLIGLSAAPLGNAPPVVAFSGTVQTFDTDAKVPVLIDANATIFDPDSTNFNGGSLTVTAAVPHANDLLDIKSGGQVTTLGNKVFFGGIQVGTFTTGDGFTVPLVVNFNANSTPAVAQAILRSVVFSTTDAPLSGPRQLQATVSDGAGGSDTSATTQEIDLADLTPPSVISITRNDSDPTNATLLNYTVKFSEDVTGVDVSDFLVTSTATIAGTSVKSVMMVDPQTYVVQVEDLTGEGTVRLDLTDDDSISDSTGNKLGGTGKSNGDFTTGQVYTIDRTAPIVIIDLAQGQSSISFTQPVHFFVSFSEVMTGFDASDVMVSGTAGANMVTVTLLKAGGTDYDVAVSGATMDGTVIIDIAAGVAVDPAGNGNEAATVFANKVTLDLINDAPVITGPSSNVAATEDKTFTFDKTNPISIHDSDLNGGKMVVTLTATDGTLTLSGVSGLMFTTGTGTGDKTMTFTGTEADVNVALANLVFTPTANFFGTTTVTISADDQGQTGAGGAQVGNSTITLDVAGVNDAPTVKVTPDPLGTVFTEDTPTSFPTGFITFADVDAGTDLVQVTLSVGHGTLTIADFSKLSFTTGDGTADAKMVFTGTIADINAALNGLSYKGDQDFNGLDSLSISINDQGHNGSGGSMSASDSFDIEVSTVNDPPVNTVPGDQTVNEDTALVFTGSNAISISDVDAGDSAVKVTLTATNGVLTLSGITGLTFTTGDGTGDASMTFTGKISDINAALTGLKFQGNLHFHGAASVTILTDDQGNSGLGGALTDTKTVNITVNFVNQAPVGVADTFQTKQNQTLHVAAPGVLANDTDAEGTALSLVLVTDVPAASGKLVLIGNGGFDFTPAPNFIGTTTFQYKASDGQAQSNVVTVTITVTENFTHLFAVGAGAGAEPHVVVHNADGSVRFSFLAFDAAFHGGVAVATGDVNGDGIEDIIVGAGPGGGPQVRVLSGANLAQIHSFMAFDPAFTGGVNVAAGDVNGDGFADIIVGAGAGGGPQVAVYDGKTGSLLQSFMAYDTGFHGGVSVAAGDYDGDGKADIVTGAGPGGGPQVAVYAGMSGTILTSFYAFDSAFTGGVNVAAGQFDMNTTSGSSPDIQPAIFAAAGAGGVPVVSVYNFNTTQQVAAIFAFEQEDKSGVHIGSENTSDGKTTLYLAPGSDHTPGVRVVDAETLGDTQNFNAFDPSFLGGVFIG
jgi:Domain of unknown function (DUF4394)/Bacterial Ig domain/FG-GAP-like repeat/FG-GAP repeat